MYPVSRDQAQLSRATSHQIAYFVSEVFLMAVHSWSFHRHLERARYFKFWHSWSNLDNPCLFQGTRPKPNSHAPWARKPSTYLSAQVTERLGLLVCPLCPGTQPDFRKTQSQQGTAGLLKKPNQSNQLHPHQRPFFPTQSWEVRIPITRS